MTTKTLALLPALLLLAAVSHGQTAPVTPNDPKASQAVTVMTREMSNHLQLNEGQYIKLYSINRIRLARQQEIERTTADAAGRTAQLAELQGQYEQECARILTPSQLSLLQQDQPNQLSTGIGQG